MARKKSKNNKDNEIWSRKFDDNENIENDEYSRTARKKAKGGISPIMTSLFIFLALLIILPTGTYLWYVNQRNGVEEFKSDNEKITITQNDSKESNSTKKDSSSKEESASNSEKTSVLEIPAKSDPEVVEETPEQSTPNEETPPVTETPESVIEESPTESTGNTYVVSAGDNLYRIALNHGMTTEQLKTLNGLSTDEVSVGTVLNVN